MTEIITVSGLPDGKVLGARVGATGWNKAEVCAENDRRWYPTKDFACYPWDEAALRERTLARFLEWPEDKEASAPDKPRMEPECLRTDTGACHWCGANGLRWRYELHPDHSEYLLCEDKVNGDYHEKGDPPEGLGMQPCPDCIVLGLVTRDAAHVYCADTSHCRWDMWLSNGRMPWLCAHCWKTITADEATHVAYLKAEY